MKKYIRQGRRFVAIPDEPNLVGLYYDSNTKSFTFTQRPSSIGVVVKQTEEEFTVCSIVTSCPLSFESAKQWSKDIFAKHGEEGRLPNREEIVAIMENDCLRKKLFTSRFSADLFVTWIWATSNMKMSPICKINLDNATCLPYGEKGVMAPARTKAFITIKR